MAEYNAEQRKKKFLNDLYNSRPFGHIVYLLYKKGRAKINTGIEEDGQNKIRTNQVRSVGSSNIPTGRANLRVKRRSLMKAKRI